MENTSNHFDVVFWGDYALFTNPYTMLTGSKYSYSLPTLSALKGMMKAIYWKPSVEWKIEAVEILSEVQRETKNVLLQADAYRATQRGTNCYLKDVAYRVRAHLVPSDYTVQFSQDQQHGLVKHVKIAHSRFSKGCGFAVPVLGVSECRAYVREAEEDEPLGFYSDKEIFADMMLLDIVYPTPDDDSLYRIFWNPNVNKGTVIFPEIKEVIQSFKDNQLDSHYVVEKIEKGNYRLPKTKHNVWDF